MLDFTKPLRSIRTIPIVSTTVSLKRNWTGWWSSFHFLWALNEWDGWVLHRSYLRTVLLNSVLVHFIMNTQRQREKTEIIPPQILPNIVFWFGNEIHSAWHEMKSHCDTRLLWLKLPCSISWRLVLSCFQLCFCCWMTVLPYLWSHVFP